MKCVIIAAGQGTRLRALAASKPLATIAGAPLIEHIVGLAAAGGASEFVVVTGYEPLPLEAALEELAERTGLPIEIVRNEDWARPNGISVLAAAPRLDGEFVLLMSDHLFDPDILRRLIAGRRAEAALTLGVDYRITRPDLDLDDATKVQLDGQGRITAIAKELPSYDAVDTGLFIASPALLQALAASVASGGAGSLSEGVAALAAEGRAFTFDIGDGWWVDVDDAPAHARAERELPAILSTL
ncbi:MAG TPA: NTP transferase domain-containing protein [Allosphingosinicella sp.]|jgi:choline kinase